MSASAGTRRRDIPHGTEASYGCSDKRRGENGDGEDGIEISGGGERVEIAWDLVF